MSMISEQIKRLRELADYWKSDGRELNKAMTEAADTIKALSAKLAKANTKRLEAYYGSGWIPCSERLPEEKINPITKDFYEYQVTFKSGDITDIRHYKFGRGHWWNCGECMDKYTAAWQPLPEPYKGDD